MSAEIVDFPKPFKMSKPASDFDSWAPAQQIVFMLEWTLAECREGRLDPCKLALWIDDARGGHAYMQHGYDLTGLRDIVDYLDQLADAHAAGDL